MKHVVMFSGGVTSWAAAKRVAEQHGVDGLTLLFCDTRTEHPDTYRWLEDAAANVGAPLVRIADGRDIWQVFRDKRLLGNDRIAPCSRVLKQEPARAWVLAHCLPADTTLVLGYDWNELHRLAATRRAWDGWRVVAPMAEAPYLDKPALLRWAQDEGIAPQALYERGARHANCGGGCVRMGIGGFLHLLRSDPATYAAWEQNEQATAAYIGKSVSILTDRTGGARRPLTLQALRARYEAQPRSCDMFSDDIGGCGCFAEPDAEAAAELAPKPLRSGRRNAVTPKRRRLRRMS